jgi:tetratricopeptide (TPR) repeat protein
MSDEFTMLAEEFSRDPQSLAFLEIGEQLRRDGRLEAAVRVALSGLERHPSLAAAHDLYARILVDIGEYDRARQIWAGIVAREPRHMGALKGLGYLSFWAGDLDGALDHLELALSVDPTDRSVIQGLQMVREAAEESEREEELKDEEEARPADEVFRGLDGAGRGLLLVNQHGQVVGGRLEAPEGGVVTDAAAAYVAAAAQEAERSARMLDLGSWRWLTAEASAAHLHLSAPDDETLLLVVRARSVPSGRLARLAERAADAARAWLEEQRL